MTVLGGMGGKGRPGVPLSCLKPVLKSAYLQTVAFIKP